MERYNPIQLAKLILDVKCPKNTECWQSGHIASSANDNPYKLNTDRYYHWANGHRFKQFLENNYAHQQKAANDNVYIYDDSSNLLRSK